MRQCLIIVLILFSVLFYSPVQAAYQAKVISVTDGDTIKILHNRQVEKIRLSDIDCPEKKQAYGNQAKQFTASLVFGHNVTIYPHGKDRYGRTIGEIWLSNGASVNRSLVRNGLAWWYKQYSHDTTYGLLQSQAQWQHMGLWHDPHPTPPWVYRKYEAKNRVAMHHSSKISMHQQSKKPWWMQL